MSLIGPNQDQVEIAQRLQMKLLERFDRLLDNNEITAAEVNTLTRLLSDNGWSLDPAMIPSSLKDKLTDDVPSNLDEPGLKVI